MLNTLKNILLIDDDYNSFITSLKIAAEEYDFRIIASDNVIDGLAYLSDYPSAFEAVILDLGFPEKEMQGMEALQKIKENHPHLPVIMLTDSDTNADIKNVVRCMKMGAYDYVGKKSLNTNYLFQLIDNAVEQSKQLRRAKASIDAQDSNKNLVLHIEDIPASGGRKFKKQAVFGYELVMTSQPKDKEAEEESFYKTLDWHTKVLRSINSFADGSLNLKLKYISENESLKIYLFFTILGYTEEDLQKKAKTFYHDISAYIKDTNPTSDTPYVFQPIADKTTLKTVHAFSEDYCYHHFHRKPIKVKSYGVLGFKASQTKSHTKDEFSSSYQPDQLFPLQKKVDFNDDLFSALYRQKDFVEIDIYIQPQNLNLEELRLLKTVSKKTSLIEDESFQKDEAEHYARQLIEFTKSSTPTMLMSVVLKQRKKTIPTNLKSAIESYFFGSQKTQTDLRPVDDLNRFNVQSGAKTNQVPFYYTIETALQVFRLPFPKIERIPGVNTQAYTHYNLPDNISKTGILIGEKNTLKGKTPILLNEDTLARHLYIMGQTGTGKSTMLKSMIADCIRQNKGFAVIDPHGDLFDEVQKIIPKAKRKKLVVLNTSDPGNSARHNPLIYDKNNPNSKSLIINELMRIFASLYDMKQAGGPMFEMYFKNGLLLLMNDQVQEKFGLGTLQDFVNIYYDDDYRISLLDACDDDNVKRFFKKAEETSGEQIFANFAPYIASKVNRFVDDYFLSPIVTSNSGNIDYRELMDKGHFLLVKMDKGTIGTDNVSILGQMVLSSLVLTAMSRSNLPAEQRQPFYLFIDEFQNFIKSDVGTALSEVRKYGLSLTLANQTLGQLDYHMVESLLGNVGSMVFFRPGINDYEKIKHYLEPDFTRAEVLKLPNFNVISRLLIDNIPSEPFLFQNKYE